MEVLWALVFLKIKGQTQKRKREREKKKKKPRADYKLAQKYIEITILYDA